MTLGPQQFAEFYEAVNGYQPFPWQERLVAESVAHGGRWPAVLDLPTSAGKTSALDAAVFLLALEAGKPVGERVAALRTFFVVDRRIVVDEAAEKARKLARKLIESPTGVAKEVADRLLSFGGGKPLHVSVLRGGMYRDGSWAESPTQPTVCLSTVDQVGSRLLFRGYGVGPNQRAVHAGLVGNDALFLVDEAHLSRPFLETLKAVEFYRSPAWTEEGRHVRTPFQVVVMSATAGAAAAAVGPMAVEEAERLPKLQLADADRAHEKLKPRLGAAKLARLEEFKSASDDEGANRAGFAEKLAALARELSAPPAAPARKGRTAEPQPSIPEANVIGVVVNRVDTARRVYRLLEAEQVEGKPAHDVILLTGRIRPYDRDRLLDRWFPYMEAKENRPRLPDDRKLFVVATQTVEVGANLSFDALVTEAAPIDALRQRFGRLDRLGLRARSAAAVVARKDLLRDDDPVYGDRVKATWDWLATKQTGTGKTKRLDFGIDAFDTLLPLDAAGRGVLLESLSAPISHAPVMLPAHVDDLVQTTVPPVPDLNPALFLHGPEDRPADVSVVWRADLTPEVLRSPRIARRLVGLVPPVSMEALPLPVWHVRKWLQHRSAGADFTDIEGERAPPPDRRQGRTETDPFLIWNGPAAADGTTVSRDPDDIHPGATIVVPSTYGGCDEFGWNPDRPEPVADVADDCSWQAKRRPVLRVNRAGTHRDVLVGSEKRPAAWAAFLDEPFRREATALLEELIPGPESEEPDWSALKQFRDWLPEAWQWLIPTRSRRPTNYPGSAENGFVVVGPRTPHPADPTAADTTEDGPAGGDVDSFRGGRFPLAAHCAGVRKWVEKFADLLGLTAYRDTLAWAAQLHDAGKADPRFQEWLYGNAAEFARGGELIAKSGTDGRDAVAMDAARKRAGWPKHARHEALSVLLVRDHPTALAEAGDPELLLHLIGTHHGRGRPLWLLTLDDELPEGAEAPTEVAGRLGGFDFKMNEGVPARPEAELTPLHAGWVDGFWRAVGRYGYWGLAYLETLLILADHRQSESEREAGG